MRCGPDGVPEDGGRSRHVVLAAYGLPVTLVGRATVLAGVEALLADAADGVGGAATIVGPPGSGKSAVLAAAADVARAAGWEVVAGSPAPGLPGLSLWASLLDDVGAPAELTRGLIVDDAGPQINEAVRWLVSGSRRLIVIDDLDAADPQCLGLLRVLTGRLLGRSTAVIAAGPGDLGIGRVVRLKP